LNFHDLQGEGNFSPLNFYRGSKKINLMFTYPLAKQLEGITSLVVKRNAAKFAGFKLVLKII